MDNNPALRLPAHAPAAQSKQYARTTSASVGIALNAVRAHKLRAFLTVLGVIIGTGTIIGVGSILTGLDGAITNILKSFGTDTIIALKWSTGVRFGRTPLEERKRKVLTLENAYAIRDRCPSVEYVSPYLFPARNTFHRAKYQSNDVYNIDLGGTEERYALGGQAEMKEGRFFTEFENQHRVAVAVIGEDIYKQLYSGMEAIGKPLEVDGHTYTVIGVMNRPANSFPGQQDLRVLLPYFTMRKLNPGADDHMLVITAKHGLIAKAMDEVRGVLRQERRLAYNAPDNFSLSTAEQMIADFRQVMSVTALVMVVLSSIGLLVGGIGVMNIMLVSVTERTKEIGLRKAVGARRIDIIVQFLTEATVLTGIGGVLGMLMGWLISRAVGLVFPSLPTSVPVWAATLGVAVSVGVGLFFGLWPATKAARLDPVEALRYE
ncbi:MAG: ABC transporter permease [Bryobacterales bacterium]|nr:ABC transporter permease [Bryobacterales bacterium]